MACAGSSPNWIAADASRTEVNNCVAGASRGDTITVPAGSANWATGITLTKGLKIKGAGIGNTVLTATANIAFFDIAPDATAISTEQPTQIDGFTLDGANLTDYHIHMTGESGVSGTKPYRNVIIGNNRFVNARTSAGVEVGAAIGMPPNGNGQIRGVIYLNQFHNCNIILRIFSNNDTSEWSNTAFNQLAYGTSDDLYFEDNTITFSGSYAGDNPGWSESGQGGRVVIRYNTYNQSGAATPQEIWDVHGFQNWNHIVNGGQTSTMITEIYGNSLTNMGTFRSVNHRGSWGMFFNNVITGSGASSTDLYGTTNGSCDNMINPVPSNYSGQVNNTYFFNNTVNGTNSNPTVNIAPTGTCTISADSAYWVQASTSINASPCTTSACTSGVGRATSNPTGTCTDGVAMWVASDASALNVGANATGTAATNQAIMQAGHLWKCVAGTWTNYYTPYTYPHPLRGSAPVTPPAPVLYNASLHMTHLLTWGILLVLTLWGIF